MQPVIILWGWTNWSNEFNLGFYEDEPPTIFLSEPKKEEPKSFYVDANNSDDAVKLIRIIAKENNGSIKIPLKIQSRSDLLNREIEKFLKIIKMSDVEFMNRLEAMTDKTTTRIKKSIKKNKGAGIDKKELRQFVDAGYKKKKEAKTINGYVLDRELSTKRDKVYYDPKTKKAVHTIAGTDRLTDWANNLLIPLGLHHKTQRYKDAENIQKKANAKYGKENLSLVSHSQSGNIADNLAKRNLVGDENITLNPAIIGRHNKNLKVVKSSGDVVSVLTKTNKDDEIIKSKTYNPLTEHSGVILGRGRRK